MSKLDISFVSSSLEDVQKENLSFDMQKAFETHVLNAPMIQPAEQKDILQEKLNDVLADHGFADNKANLALDFDPGKCVAEIIIHF